MRAGLDGQMAAARVLIVDDDEGIRVSFPRLLRRTRYEVLVAESAEAALDLLAAQAVDVIVSDCQMPGMRGPELLARVRSLYPTVACILLSGELGPTDAEPHPYTTLLKPTSLAELTQTIAKSLLDRRVGS
jgi:adenylate cyclase